MATSQKRLSDYDKEAVPDASKMKFGIVVSEWNAEITDSLFKGCFDTLVSHRTEPANIIVTHVPGSFELPAGAQFLAQSKPVDAVICIGCIIKGETKHDEYISQSVANGLVQLALKFDKPFVFGVLTPNNIQQAKDRAGGKYGNKGIEAAVTAIKMVGVKSDLD